jgi:hypothetical protein
MVTVVFGSRHHSTRLHVLGWVAVGADSEQQFSWWIV